MQIYFERSGGFMGLHLKTAVESADLTVEEVEEWEQILATAGFFELPSRLESESGPDRLIYSLTVVTTEREHTVQFSDEDAPEEIRPLLQQLELKARQK